MELKIDAAAYFRRFLEPLVGPPLAGIGKAGEAFYPHAAAVSQSHDRLMYDPQPAIAFNDFSDPVAGPPGGRAASRVTSTGTARVRCTWSVAW